MGKCYFNTPRGAATVPRTANTILPQAIPGMELLQVTAAAQAGAPVLQQILTIIRLTPSHPANINSLWLSLWENLKGEVSVHGMFRGFYWEIGNKL